MLDSLEAPSLIDGGNFVDHRGKLTFANDFHMDGVKRFYIIQHPTSHIVRGWRGHKTEQRWFFATKGEFKVNLVKIDNWIEPDRKVAQLNYLLSEGQPQVLHIPKGYASKIENLKENSELLVFADFPIAHAKEDEYIYGENYFEPENFS